MKKYSQLLQKDAFTEDWLQKSSSYFLLLAWKIAKEDNRNNLDAIFYLLPTFDYPFCSIKKI